MAINRSHAAMVLALGLVPLVLGQGGCSKPRAPIVGKAPTVQSVGKPLTAEECVAMGDEITKAVDSGEIAALDQLIDWDQLNQSSTAGIDASPQMRKGFITGMNQARAAGKGFSETIISSLKKGGSYHLLHSHTKDKQPWLLFRLLLPEAGVSYQDFLIARRPGGKAKIVDIYLYASGETISQTIRRLFIQAATQGSGGLINKLTGDDQKFAKYIKDLGEMGEARREG